MLAFNLLPQPLKLQVRREHNKKIIFFCAFSVALIILITMVFHHPTKKVLPATPVPYVYTPSFKWVGYLQQGQRFWALLLLTNDKVIVAQQGSVIEQARIVKLNEHHLVIEKNHRHYTLQRIHHD
jgi:hypothetical protein